MTIIFHIIITIAHDLKNPFHVIRGYCDLLIDQYHSWDDEKRLQFLKLLKDSTTSAYNLLENLLHWSRNQMGTVNFNPVPYPAIEIVNNVIQEISSFSKKKEIEIIFESKEPDIVIQADKDMICLVMRNLLSNAIKFSKPVSKVYINIIADTKNYVQFDIIDEGLGISKEELKSIFLLNKNKSNIGTNGEKGTGLGLILCKEFIEIHNGKIWVKSKLNEGTKFSFNIPSAI